MATSARETAYEIIRERIIHLDLKPGQALNDKELAEELGMSRTPVREAVLMLGSVRLVSIRPQSGTFVTPIDMGLVDMEQFMRSALEKEVARIAASFITDKGAMLYKENLALYEFYEKSDAEGRAEKFLKLDNDFHRIAFKICGRENVYDHMQASMQHIERLRVLSLKWIKDDYIYADHSAIAEAILDGNCERAAAKIEEHMTRYVGNVAQIRAAEPQYFTSVE